MSVLGYGWVMTYDLFIALAAFAFVSSITPGPNNMMLMASGANFGFRRTLPHMTGVTLGFMVMLITVGLGLMQVFDAYPIIYTVLKVLSVSYLLYLAWKIATSAPISDDADPAKQGVPFTFLQAALFQWVNPKAWTMGLTAITVYTADRSVIGVLLVGVIFAFVNLPAVSFWTIMGGQMKRFLTSPARLRAFNGAMALLLVGSLYPVAFEAIAFIARSS